MGAQEAAVEDVLRAAAAEVSTSSAKRRFRLFRHTLPLIIAKVIESPSDTALLVDIIFQTLPIYDDRASRKAVDDMVIQALGEPTFMKPFAAFLVQSMEKNLKVINPLTSFKLLRWSHYLLKWSQFATLSKVAFTRLASAQAVLCQVLMDGSFRRRRTCKQLFIHLLSEPSGIYKMYMEELKDLRISMRDSPAFLNLILDFTISSPSLSTEYKSVFLDLYVKTILSSKDRAPKAATEAFKPLLLEIGHEDFKNTVIPSCIKMLKRNPEIILQSIGYLLRTVRLDLSKYFMEFMPIVLHQARHSDEERRIDALSIIGTLSEKSSDPDALPSMVNAIKVVLGGSEGKLSLPYQRIGMINALEQLSRSPPKQISRLAPSVSSFFLTCYKDDGIEEVKLAILSAMRSWALVSAEAVQPDVVSFIAAGLKEKDNLRKGHLKFLRVICKNSDSLTKVASLLDHLIQLSKTGFSKTTQRLDGIYALFAVRDLHVSTSLWIAAHDPEKVVAELAEELWDRFGFDVITDYSDIFNALSHKNYNVRVASAEALSAALDENQDKMQDALSTLFSLYIRDLGPAVEFGDAHWLGRQGIALALHSTADVLAAKDLPVVMTFLISRALADPNVDVRGRMINAGILIIDRHGKENVPLLFPIFESYLNKRASDEETYDLVREGVVIFTGALAKHLSKDDPKVHSVIEKLLDVLNTPSEAVQRAVSDCLSPLMVSKQEEGQTLVSRLLDRMMKCEKYGERRGAAFGLAGVVKGFGISSLKKYGIAATLQKNLEDRMSAKSREGALLGFECLCEKLGKLFEPYVIQMLPFLLVSFSDQVLAVREAAECAARAMMSQLTGPGVKLVLPSLLKGLEDKAWRTKQSSVQLLGAMAYCAPQQLSQCLPKIVPKLTEVLTDTHPKVQASGQTALQEVGSVIKNPEISALVPILLSALMDPNAHTKHSLDILLQTTFINSIDAPSLALLVPIVHRGLRERGVETKKKAAQIVGNMSSLVTEPKDMIPYISLLLPEVKKVLVDPIPEVRAVAARALGSLISGMGEEIFPDLVPWLLDTLKSDNSNVERSGAAQGLSEVLAALGQDYFDHILPDIIRNCSHQKASVRDGHLTLFRYLPRSLGGVFQNYLQAVLPAILDGLADENESVRDAALSAGHVFVEHYATTSLPLLLPAIEDGIFSDNWRIRQSSVELLGDLLFKVAGTSGKAILEGGSDDEGASTEAQGRAIIEVLGREKRNEVLAAIYMVRSDVSLTVRQAALHVWKTIVANTPRTLKEIMPVLMDTLISSLASSSSERRQVAGRSLGELVRKLGERVLPSIIPILSQGLKDPSASRRQGVCIGLSEVMGSAGKHQLLSFMDELIPTIRTALCDSTQEVRESAGLAFSTLYKSAGLQAIDEIVPTLLRALEDDDTSATALDGLKQILSVRTAAVLPHILPKLVQPPLSSFNAHALGALAEVAGPGLNSHIRTVLPALILAMDDEDVDVKNSARKAAETVLLVIDEEGVETLIPELLRGITDSQASMRRGSAYLIGFLFKNTKLYLADEASDMMSTLIILLSDTDKATVSAALEAFSRVVASVPKEQLPTHIKLVRDAVSTARDKERRRRKGVPILLPGLCLSKALQPFLPIFQQGLISGSAETKEQAAEGLGELIDVTSEKTLKEVVVPITGPLIRILGDRFPWQVKSAILSTLTIIIMKGGIALKPFLPQLQTTFVKCLQDNNKSVRTRAAAALGKLSALSTRVDPLVSDLLSMLQSGDESVKESVLSALKGVIKHAGKSVSAPIRSRGCALLEDLLQAEADDIRSCAAKVIGTLSQYMDDREIPDLVQILLEVGTSSDWCTRHGALLALSSISMHSPSKLCDLASFPSLVDLLKDSLKDDKFPVREVATRTLGRILVFELQSEADTLQLVQLLVLALRDDSSEVRRRSLSCIKAAAKMNHSALATHHSILGPAIADALKDSSMPVRLAAERCALHVFQLTKGPDNVTTAQKYLGMTGLEVKKIAKLNEESDGSESSDDDRRT
ncbi:ILITYHIA [Zea mays]|uniref:ILITYHIA n=1 Tax=Zea mays TaxID=4577 RepID=A0A1D6L2L2_MAIZE|nr:ILITYHIA [Zea mays]